VIRIKEEGGKNQRRISHDTREWKPIANDDVTAQCSTLQYYAITQACFNISSDAFMLGISLPLLLSTTLPLKQKVVLVGIFGMGLFVVSDHHRFPFLSTASSTRDDIEKGKKRWRQRTGK